MTAPSSRSRRSAPRGAPWIFARGKLQRHRIRLDPAGLDGVTFRSRLRYNRRRTMQASHPTPGGLWLPLITPFRDGMLDEASLRRLVQHYAGEPIDGL